MNVTRQMLGKAHDVLLKRGLMLSGEMLEEIYLAMDALANHAETSCSPQKEQAVSSEPVAWMYKESDQHSGTTLVTIEPMSIYGKGIPLFTTPPNHREAMSMALEAMSNLRQPTVDAMDVNEFNDITEAIAALKEALK